MRNTVLASAIIGMALMASGCYSQADFSNPMGAVQCYINAVVTKDAVAWVDAISARARQEKDELVASTGEERKSKFDSVFNGISGDLAGHTGIMEPSAERSADGTTFVTVGLAFVDPAKRLTFTVDKDADGRWKVYKYSSK